MSPVRSLERLKATIAHLEEVATDLERRGMTEAAAHTRDGVYHLRQLWKVRIAQLPTPDKQRHLDELVDAIGTVSIDDLEEA